MQCPIHTIVLKSHSDQQCKDIVVFLGFKVYNSDNSLMFSFGRNAQVSFEEKP